MITLVAGASYLGCFKDASRRAIPVLLKQFPGGTQNKLKQCGNLAAQKGFGLFGFQHQDECWSGKTAHLTYNKYGPQTTCSAGLGGAWGNDVYLLPGGCVMSRPAV